MDDIAKFKIISFYPIFTRLGIEQPNVGSEFINKIINLLCQLLIFAINTCDALRLRWSYGGTRSASAKLPDWLL